MDLNKEQENLYKKTMEEARKQLKDIEKDIDAQMEKEIQKLREKLAHIQESKKYFKQIYEGAAKLLGVEIEEEKKEEKNISGGALPSSFQNLQ